MKTPTYEEIKPYIEKKLISENVHPGDSDVRIFNYTQKCQFDGVWDDVTRQCRGLILNVKTGEVLARPFPKFFNYREHIDKGWGLPEENPIVYTKFDGSLGILYWLNGKPCIATRGSFTSDQAIWANNYIQGHGVRLWIEELDKGYTHLFEIIYPENRIVVKYNFSELVHLTSIDIKTGKSIGPDSCFPMAYGAPFTSYDEIEKSQNNEEEGFVLFYPLSETRVKIKFPEYVRLHRIVTGISEIAIWEMLRDGKNVAELLEKVPDEFFNWVTDVATRLQHTFNKIEDWSEDDYQSALRSAKLNHKELGSPLSTEERKRFAVETTICKYPQLMFARLDQRMTSPIIWRMVRPSGAKVFKTDIDS